MAGHPSMASAVVSGPTSRLLRGHMSLKRFGPALGIRCGGKVALGPEVGGQERK